MPSWWISVALGAQPPGTLPPMSIQWPVVAMTANSSPSANTGAMIWTSCRWLPPRYVSFMIHMSPGLKPPSAFGELDDASAP